MHRVMSSIAISKVSCAGFKGLEWILRVSSLLENEN